jgi:L-asparaginase II
VVAGAPQLLATTIRSGLTEAFHDGDVVAIDGDGTTLLSLGDPDLPIYYRSAIKPIQATVAVEHGADLPREHLALACASHSGWPVHLATVAAMLRAGGLDASALQCPRSWPLAPGARDLLVGAGHLRKRRIYHNCSGKHAGFLRACVAQGWPTDSYLAPDHPLQRRIAARVADTTGVDPTPAGVDGCGAPAMRGSIRGLARAFSHLTTDPALAEAADAMAACPALVGGNERLDGRIGAWWGGPLKVGAQGVLAAGRGGIGIAVKSRSGSGEIAAIGMMEVMRRLGMLSDAAHAALRDVAHVPVLGGGLPVGAIGPPN